MNVLQAFDGPGLGVELIVLLVLKGAPLLVALVVLGRLLRGASPALRSALWTSGGAALLLLPVAALYVPSVGAGMVEYPETWLEPTGGGTPLALWLLVAWGAGAAWLLGRFGAGLGRAVRDTRRAAPCRDERVLAVARSVRDRLGVKLRVRVLISEGGRSPFTWGWLRPVILLPRSARRWPEPRLRAVLLHEMAHVVRRDFLVLVVLELARAVHWPNPLAWHLLARAREDQEKACDLAAVEGGLEAPVYARQLVELARSLLPASRSPDPVLPVVRPSSLGSRVRCVMDARERTRRGARSWAVAGVAVLVTALALPVAAVNAWVDCPEEASVSWAAETAGSAGPAASSSPRLRPTISRSA